MLQEHNTASDGEILSICFLAHLKDQFQPFVNQVELFKDIRLKIKLKGHQQQ